MIFNTRLNSNEFDKLEKLCEGKNLREKLKICEKLKQKIWEKTLKEEIRESLRLVTLLSNGVRNHYKDVFL